MPEAIVSVLEDHAIAWLATNRDWSVYIAEGGSARAHEAFEDLTPEEQHHVWTQVRQSLGLAEIADPSRPHHVPHLPEASSHHEDGPMMPGDPSHAPRDATEMQGDTTATGGQGSPGPLGDGSFPRGDGQPAVTGVGVTGTYGSAGRRSEGASGDPRRDGHDNAAVVLTGGNLQSGLIEDPVVAPASRTAYTPDALNPDYEEPTTGYSLDEALHTTPEQFAAQFEALQVMGRELDVLAGVVAHTHPHEVHQAILLLLGSVRDLLEIAHAQHPALEMSQALLVWDTQSPETDPAHQDAWSQAATSIYESAQHAYDAWHAFCSEHHQLLRMHADMIEHATQLTQWANEAHRELETAVHQHY